MLAQALTARRFEAVQRYLFAPHPYLVPISIRLQGTDVILGGRIATMPPGAHWRRVGAMLRDCGAAIALVGHSERRADHGETSALVRAKATQALAHELAVMICVGETLAEREAGQAEQVVIDQLRTSMPVEAPPGRVLIAYEPVWAIGTGKVASIDDIGEMHAAIAGELPVRQNGTEAPQYQCFMVDRLMRTMPRRFLLCRMWRAAWLVGLALMLLHLMPFAAQPPLRQWDSGLVNNNLDGADLVYRHFC